MFVRQGNYLLVVFLITLFVVLHDSAHAQTTCSNKLLAEMVGKITETYGLQELKSEVLVPNIESLFLRFGFTFSLTFCYKTAHPFCVRTDRR